MQMSIKELRADKGLTQKQCAEYLGIPLRTYKRYEADDGGNPVKYDYIVKRLNEYGHIDEEHGMLTVKQIEDICRSVMPDYGVEFCYLFGSYAKGAATEKSDVDLLVSLPVNGLKYYELIEVLREKLGKKVDLLDTAQLNNNPELVNEILKDGIKIYG